MLEKLGLGFCFWDIPAAVLLAVVIAALVIQQRKHKRLMAERGKQKERALIDKQE